VDTADFIDRIASALRSFLKLEGRGAVSATADRIGVHPSYFRVMLPTGLPTRKLGATLAALDLEPAIFFARAFGTVDPVDHFRSDARRLRRREAEHPLLAGLRTRLRGGELAPEPEADDARSDELEVIDDLRYENLGQATTRAASAVRRAADRLTAARALGIWASCMRLHRQLDDATLALDLAFELAGTARPLAGELAQRAAFVLHERGEYLRGLALVEQALIAYVEANDPDRIGRTLVDRGVLLYQLGEPAAALLSYKSSLRYLAASSQRNRGAAMQGLGRIYYEMGNLDQAAEVTREAARVLPSSGTLAGHLAWLRAAIASDLGNHRQAEAQYRRALVLFAEVPDDALLVAAQLVRLLCRQGRTDEGCDLTRSLLWLVEPLEGDRVLQACLADLIRAGMEGSRALTLELVEATIRTIERERSRRIARAQR